MDYWIQRATFDSTNGVCDTVDQLLDIYSAHDWSQELELQRELEAMSQDCCPPGLGIVAQEGVILHLCPLNKDLVMIHYHWLTPRKVMGVSLSPVSEALSWEEPSSAVRSRVLDFVGGEHEKLLNAAKLAGVESSTA